MCCARRSWVAELRKAQQQWPCPSTPRLAACMLVSAVAQARRKAGTLARTAAGACQSGQATGVRTRPSLMHLGHLGSGFTALDLHVT